MWHDMGWGGMWFGWLILIIVVVSVVWAVTRLTASGQFRNQTPISHESPLDILKRRYAKGEINREQFEQIKKDLS